MTNTDTGQSTKMIINEFWLFGIGADPNSKVYILKDILSLQLIRPKTRRAIKAGPSNTYGVGDHTCEVIIDADTDNLEDLTDLNSRGTTGGMTIKDFFLQATGLTGAVKKIAFKGIAAEVELVSTGNDGRLQVRIKIDITTDDITVT